MNAPTTTAELKTQLVNARLENKHLNAVNQELCDELTAAKLEIKELKEFAEHAHCNALRILEVCNG
ncbi:hypothetical protein ORI99_00205 [Alishewanella sp. SMS9]|nr:hypothetical protein [Alishewanella sp. SMS9]